MSVSLFGVLLFFGAAALGLGTMSSILFERRQVFRTLQAAQTIDLSPSQLRKRELAMPFVSRVGRPMLQRFGRLGRRFAPASVLERLNQELMYAGSPRGWDAERVVAIKLIGIGAGPVVGLAAMQVLGLAPARALILGIFVAFLGYYVPEWSLRSKAKARQKLIQRALPDALDLLSITVEAGLAFDAAVARVARQSGGPLGEEFHRLLQEMQIGKARADALRDLGDRSTVQELKSFTLAMVQADIFGVSIAKVLQTQAHEMRVKRRQRIEEKAQKLQVKIIFPLILCIVPSLFVILLGPAMLTIYDSLMKSH